MSTNSGKKKSPIELMVIPALLPMLLANLYVLNKMFDADLPWYFAIGMYMITTLIPSALSVWYGWALKTEYNKNEQN